MAINGDFDTDFELDEQSGVILKIHNDGVPNRNKLTADEVGSTSFGAKLVHVQYGTYDSRAAALLVFDFQFAFKRESMKRITSASIQLTFEETDGPELGDVLSRNPKNDPAIALLAPAQVCGQVSTVEKTQRWNLEIPLQIQQFGLEAGATSGMEDESVFAKDHRMWLLGMTTSDDLHHSDNVVRWFIQENSVQKSGILHRFSAAVVITLPANPENPVRVSTLVRPFVAFSLNPLRLRQKKDDPVFLDRKTPKGESLSPGLDFKSPDFPWSEVVKVPTEYTVGCPKLTTDLYQTINPSFRCN